MNNLYTSQPQFQPDRSIDVLNCELLEDTATSSSFEPILDTKKLTRWRKELSTSSTLRYAKPDLTVSDREIIRDLRSIEPCKYGKTAQMIKKDLSLTAAVGCVTRQGRNKTKASKEQEKLKGILGLASFIIHGEDLFPASLDTMTESRKRRHFTEGEFPIKKKKASLLDGNATDQSGEAIPQSKDTCIDQLLNAAEFLPPDRP